jgi:hypothetical protein
MSKFDEFVEAVLSGSKDLAKNIFDGFEENAKEDANAFLKKAEVDLKRWTKLLAAKKLTERDFSDLVHAKKALAEIHALTQAGVALTRLERFRSGLIDLVIDTAFKVFIPLCQASCRLYQKVEDVKNEHKIYARV